MGVVESEDLRTFAQQPDGSYLITGDMVIGDVVAAFPKAAAVMLEHGLHCVGCHANAFDTVEDGARGHGMPDTEIAQMVDEINAQINKRIDTILFTPGAIAKVKGLRCKEQGKETWPLRVKAWKDDCCGVAYEMDFDERTDADVLIIFDGLDVIIDQSSLALLRGSEIDYVDSLHGSGFKIENPNSKRCAC
jgi:iron-sulfur cluster assembly accessory protein